MPDYSDHSTVIKLLKDAQEADHDMREHARERVLFVSKRDGQWEPDWWTKCDGKPRYTMDMTTPIVDQVYGYISSRDFGIKVKPAGGDASKDVALVYEGMIRNIQNISGASHIYNSATHSTLTAGLSGWRVSQRYANSKSFDQDLMIEPIANYIDRVWHDPAAIKQDKSDSKYCFVLQSMSKSDFKERFSEGGNGASVSIDSTSSAYLHKPDLVIAGEFYYIKKNTIEIAMMSNGKVYEVDDSYLKVADELAAVGVNEARRRRVESNRVYVRFFDNDGWLEDEKETAFSYVPIVPMYGEFQIYENKTIFSSVVERLLDPQRVLNYSISREIEEGALAPRAKYWMTRKQAENPNDKESLRTLNSNSDPVQFFEPDERLPGPPAQQGGAQINPGLRVISESMRDIIGQSAGMFAANMGDNPGLQSGVAIRQLKDTGDAGNDKYVLSREIATAHTAKILIDAIPRVYDTPRMVRIIGEDGSIDMTSINEVVYDNDTQSEVTLNDLSQGVYDVVCESGPSFKSSQEELLSKMIELAQLDPDYLELGGDVILNNITAPGMKSIADRKRLQLIDAGLIPEDQLTEEEMKRLQRMASQPKQPDPMMLAAQAEMDKADADQAKVQADFEIKMRELEIKEANLQLELAKIQQKGGEMAITASQRQEEFELKLEQAIADIDKKNAETLKLLREAMGVDGIVSPHGMKAYSDQAKDISDKP